VDNASANNFLGLLRERQAPTTSNRNLQILKGFGTWAVKQGHSTENYFASICPLKVERAPKRDNPFTADEVKRFLATINLGGHQINPAPGGDSRPALG